nr:hypothetical protein [uncultured Oscillibacter sp.]
METTEQTVQAAEPRQRRVGTFTLGVVLVIAGLGMLAAMFYPRFQPEWLLRASPCILVLLGVETLLSARGGGRVKYDWLGMFLCFVLTGAALCMYCAAWWVAEGPGLPMYNGSWNDTGGALVLRYDYFNDSRSHWLELEAGDTLEIQCDNQEGWLSVEIYGVDNDETVFDQDLAGRESAQVEIPSGGDYYIWICGHRAQGRASFTRVPRPEAETPEVEPYSQTETAPEAEDLP